MNKYMKLAIKEAKKSLKTNDIPVGAIIVENDKIIAKAHNTREKCKMITGHAEINVINKATKKKKSWHLNNCELYVTLEPCKMCQTVIEQSKIKKIYYAAKNKSVIPKTTVWSKQIDDNGCSEQLIRNFFQAIRK